MGVFGWGLGGMLVLAAMAWFVMRRQVDVPCTIEVQSTHDSFHAHVSLEGVEVDPGDSVLVHGAPARVPFGTQEQYASTATVERASWLRRQFVKLTGGTELYELYDVGFEG
jgi:hypothetical protein